MLQYFNDHWPRIHPKAFVFDTAVVIGRTRIAPGVSVWPGAVLRADVDEIVIGKDTNLQDGVLVHTNHCLPVLIGKRVTIGHGAIIHGCRIGDRCLIGMGAILLDGAVIGNDCIIGAGALVTEKAVIPQKSLVLGLPGRIVRRVTADEIKKNKKSAEEYKELCAIYAASNRR